jgi:hypothetical protein
VEARLWTLGATSHMGNNNRWAREGGVIDELLIENCWRNPEGNPVLFDTVLLDAARFPEIGLRLQQLSTVEPTAGTFLATVVFAIKGAEFARPLTVTVRALDAESVDGDGSHGSYVASGTWSVTHAELGLTPYSAAGGLLKVGDPIEVRFRLVAKPR